MPDHSNNPYGDLTDADRHIYGAEDMQELVSILDALERVGGPHQEPAATPLWDRINRAHRSSLASLKDDEVPASPGVCVIFHDEEPVFVGSAVSARGLRGRLRDHRATDSDLSRSTLRASVAVDQLGVSRWTARQRPGVLPEWAIETVNEFVSECDVAWIECSGADEARALKHGLLAEFRPEFNL